jgi:hypothetical protein
VSLLHEGVIKLVRDRPAFAADLLGQLLHIDVPWAIMPFPEDQRLLYSLLIESNLSDAARKAIEMQPGLEKFFTETQRRNYERGKAEGEAAALLKILTRRGLTLTADQQRHIVGCTDLVMLEHWIDRALTVSSIEELFR